MNKLKFVSAIALVMFLLNVVGLYFMVAHKRPPSPREVIIKKLHFDKNQIKEYDKLILIHKEEIGKNQDEIITLKDQLYRTLNTETKPEERDSLFQKLGRIQTNIEKIHYQHFVDIQKLCKENQRQDFTLLTKELPLIFARPPKPRKP